jgi:hypothetical protein
MRKELLSAQPQREWPGKDQVSDYDVGTKNILFSAPAFAHGFCRKTNVLSRSKTLLMTSRSRFLPIVAFVGAFGIAFGGAYVWKSPAKAPQVVSISGTSVADTEPVDTTQELIIDDTTSVPDTVAPTTVPETTVPETEPPATEPPKRPLPPISTDGANLQPLPGDERRRYSADDGCRSLSRSGADAECELISPEDPGAAWEIEPDGAGADVLLRDAGTEVVYSVALRSLTSPSRRPLLVDATGDGTSDLVFGWRDSGGLLGVDIVELRGDSAAVTLHLSLVDGRLTAGDGQIDAWNGVRAPGEATATSWDHLVYKKVGGRWTVDSGIDNSPPSGEFS